ncbi:MAG: metallophosphoesterase [Deltaproteobacteria bacterium]|nr:metallophosphoesterase [Deltaproteobacteria bacterium]
MRLDLIGDVHGELPALRALLSSLGYDEALRHPEGRVPVFLGDLIDRGAHGLEVALLVAEAVAAGRALCLMGNHEYNLVGWHLKVPRFEKPKHSNEDTIADVKARAEAWRPVLELFRALPLSLELPDLRVVHACWHRESLEALGGRLDAPAGDNLPAGAQAGGVAAPLWEAVRHHSPFAATERRRDLPGPMNGQDDPPHAVLLKGFEEEAPEPFTDNDGKVRHRIRSTWWLGDRSAVLDDRPQVVGHYWNLPPVGEGRPSFMPPHPSGHEALRRWQERTVAEHPELDGAPGRPFPRHGRRSGADDLVCVDFNGVTQTSDSVACVGALRWPEREVVWGLAAKTGLRRAAS